LRISKKSNIPELHCRETVSFAFKFYLAMSETQNLPAIKTCERIISNYLFASDFYEIKTWAFDFHGQQKLNEGYNDCFCLVFVRKGNFAIDVSPKRYEMHTGHVVVEKADYQYRLRPSAGECSIFNFTTTFYERFLEDYNLKGSFFFSNPNLLSIVLNSSPEIDYLHYQVLKNVPEAGKLEIDNLVLEMLQQIVECITSRQLALEIPATLKKIHMTTIEKAREYMNAKFFNDISLNELSDHCCVSPFHFSRIFKKFTSYSPYQYLMNIRLKHAEMLVRNTSTPMTDICFSSGFNSTGHFATAFKEKYGMNPTLYRKGS
jgi:AraC family transcriptional regulator